MRRRGRLFGVVAALCVLATCLAAPAVATPPVRGSFDFTDQFTDTETCAPAPWGFDIFATQHEYGFFDVYFDKDGNFVKTIVHDNINFVIMANGKTLIERDKLTIIFTADGSREIGLFAHIQGPNGLVLRDAGQLVFDANDNLLYARGPHPQFFGKTFCSALAP
jgi:hypothetical protein